MRFRKSGIPTVLDGKQIHTIHHIHFLTGRLFCHFDPRGKFPSDGEKSGIEERR